MSAQSYSDLPHKLSRKWKYLLWTLGILGGLYLIHAILSVVIITFVAQPVRVEGQAMMPALGDGDKIFISKRITELNRGDIVVFLFPEDTTKSYLKRIVGLPGEMIDIRDGKVFINGQQIEEPYLLPDQASSDSMAEPVTIKPDHYFVLGDNRRNSSDSRYWGTVPRKLIYGKFWFRYWEAD
jgi:signal peptidase I